MISSAPKLRADLTVQERETPDGRFFVVKEPVSGNFFRFREPEHFIAQQFDGETPIEVVRRRTEQRFTTTLPAATLNAFITALKDAGLLDTGDAPKKQRAGGRWRIRGNPLYLRFKLFDPDRLFTRWSPRVRLCFTPHFLVLSSTVILLATGTTIANWNPIILDFARLYHLSTLWLVLAVSFLLVSAHECAHGLTCTYFGGSVHEIGFMLIYFLQPALYCNVSDAWLFPKRSTRLWVGVSGPYFELFLWALATLAWRVTDRETWSNYLALIVMGTSGIKTCFNLNPLIKLDGYYLLSDYLEIPNLRQRSFRYVGTLIMRLFDSARRTGEEVSPRERRIYLAYGLAAMAGSLSLLGYLAYLGTAKGYLTAGGGSAIAAAFSACIVVMKLRRRFRRLFGGVSGTADPDDFGDSERGRSRESDEAAVRGTVRGSWRRWMVWTALTATGAVLVLVPRELRIPAAVDVLPSQNADVHSAVEGIIEKVYVDEGDSVRAGDVIARLSDKDVLTELEKTKADLRDARAKLAMLESGPTPEDVEVAKAAVSKAAAELTYAQSRLARFRRLFAEGLVARAELEDKEESATGAANDLVEAKRKLSALLGSIRPEQIEEAKAQIERLEAQRRYLEEQLRLLTIVSPVTGVVATPSRQLKELTGQLVKKGDLVAKVYEMDTVTAQLVVSEKDVADIRVGHQVALKVRAYPDETFHGTVTAIATSAEGTPGVGEAQAAGNAATANKTLLVTTEIDNHSHLLKPEMTGQAKIFCGQRRGSDLFMRRLARTFKVEFWGWW